MKKMLWRHVLREFRFSFARFLSITVLLGLGVFVLIGLKVTGPDMRATGNDYYTTHRMADAEIVSNTGITKADQTYMRHLPHIKRIEFGATQDAVIKGTNSGIRLTSKTDQISTNQVTKGRLPRNNHEIALSNRKKSHYKIGQSLHLVNNKGKATITGLKHTTYQIVGFVTSSDYLMKENLGATSAGTGQIATFGVVSKPAFTSSQPTVVRITYNNVYGKSYSNQYENQVQVNVDTAENRLNNRAQNRRKQLQHTALIKLNRTQAKLTTKQNQLDQQRTQLTSARQRLNRANQKLAQMKMVGAVSASQLASQMAQLTAQRQQLHQNQMKITKATPKLTSAQAKLKTQRRKISKLPDVTYQIQSRNDYNAGYNQFGEDAKRIDVLSNTFPIIFFAVALLVGFITMSRMAEEKRSEIGTLRALGYTRLDTMKVFLVYGTTAGLLGSALGAWLGTSLLPRRIFAAYAANFVIPNFQTPPSLFWISVSIIISLMCTLIPALWATAVMLKERPAILMLPKPPKSGSKVLLERLPFIWQHLSFNNKVTIRNLARYKSRMLMTIIGVLGCTALLITGFGIRDSLNGIVTTQYQDIIHYDVIGVYNPTASQEEQTDYRQAAANLKGVKHETSIGYETVTFRPKGVSNNQPISLIVPKSTTAFRQFATLRSPATKKPLHFSNNGAIITQKMAVLGHLKVGDYLTVERTTGQKDRIRVAGITEMYAGHSLYMNEAYYRKAFGHNVQENAKMLMLKDRTTQNIDHISRQLTKQDASLTAIQSDDAKTTINHILAGLNHLVVIIIAAASMLAFVVLFTLTNINVSERIRELSTIKVLGFYPMEVVMYVYRETFILTLAGIFSGFIAGAWLHNYIMQTLPPETAMVKMTLLWTNFTTAGVMTLIFSVVVMGIMAYKINRVDMLGALKSVD